MSNSDLPDWERVLSEAAHLQQLANPLPHDLETTNLKEYKHLRPILQDWEYVKQVCARSATMLFDRLSDRKRERDT